MMKLILEKLEGILASHTHAFKNGFKSSGVCGIYKSYAPVRLLTMAIFFGVNYGH